MYCIALRRLPAFLLQFVCFSAFLPSGVGAQEKESDDVKKIKEIQLERDKKELTISSPSDWSGEMDRISFGKVGHSLIVNEKDWKSKWAILHGSNPAVPKVDFKKHLLLIVTADANDPNMRSTKAFLSKEGVLMVKTTTTLEAFQSSNELAFQIFRVPRKNVRQYLYFDPVKRRFSLKELK